MSKNLVLLALSAALALTCTLANAEMYKVNVKRTDSNS